MRDHDVELPPPLRCCQGDLPPLGAGAVVLCAGCGGRWHAGCHRADRCCQGHPAIPEEDPAARRVPVGRLRACNRCQTLFRAPASWVWRCERCSRNDTWFAVVVLAAYVAAPVAATLFLALLARGA